MRLPLSVAFRGFDKHAAADRRAGDNDETESSSDSEPVDNQETQQTGEHEETQQTGEHGETQQTTESPKALEERIQDQQGDAAKAPEAQTAKAPEAPDGRDLEISVLVDKSDVPWLRQGNTSTSGVWLAEPSELGYSIAEFEVNGEIVQREATELYGTRSTRWLLSIQSSRKMHFGQLKFEFGMSFHSGA